MNLSGYNPDFNADEAVWGWARQEALATCAWEAGRQCRGGSTNSCRADQPTRRSETALPDSPAIKGRITPARLPAGITTPGKCASHLDFGLVLSQLWNQKGKGGEVWFGRPGC